MKIPLCVLLASCVILPKNDIRQYLCFTKIQHGAVVSGDGHRAFICEIDGLEGELFIHPRYIKLLASQLDVRERKDTKLDVDITIKDGVVIMQCQKAKVMFDDVNEGKYPDVRKAIPNEYVDCMVNFNWQYLIDMSKIAKILGSSNHPIVKPSGKNKAAIIDFNCKFNAMGIVMPIRE